MLGYDGFLLFLLRNDYEIRFALEKASVPHYLQEFFVFSFSLPCGPGRKVAEQIVCCSNPDRSSIGNWRIKNKKPPEDDPASVLPESISW